MFQILQDILGAQWWLILAITVYGLAWAVYGDLYRHETSRRRWIVDLRRNHWGLWYRNRLRGTLRWVDRKLPGPDTAKPIPGPAIATAFSTPLLNVCFGLAVIYPIGFALIQWLWTGSPLYFGIVLVYPANVPPLDRLGTLVLLILSALAWRIAFSETARQHLVARLRVLRLPDWPVDLAMMGIAVGVAFSAASLSSITARLVEGPFELFSNSTSYAVSMAALIAGVAAAGKINAWPAGLIAVLYMLSALFSAAAAPDYFVGIQLVVFFATYTLVDVTIRESDRPSSVLLIFGFVLLSALLMLVTYVPIESQYARGASALLTFLAILPILNGLADFLSTGLTRLLLARSVRGDDGWPWEWLADALAAVAVLIGLGSVAIWLGATFGLSHGVALIEVKGLLEGIAERPEEHWWVFGMLFSTLVPTVLHLALGSFGLALRSSRRLRLHIADDLAAAGAGDVVRGRWGVQWLCLTMAVTVMLPVFAVGTVIEYAGEMGCGLLWLFRSVAALSGVAGVEGPPGGVCAPPPSGPPLPMAGG